MPISLIATKCYPYGSRSLKTGDRFEAPEPDADLLLKLNMATRVVSLDPTSMGETVTFPVTPIIPEEKVRRRSRRREPDTQP